jgi:hypothetical protein
MPEEKDFHKKQVNKEENKNIFSQALTQIVQYHGLEIADAAQLKFSDPQEVYSATKKTSSSKVESAGVTRHYSKIYKDLNAALKTDLNNQSEIWKQKNSVPALLFHNPEVYAFLNGSYESLSSSQDTTPAYGFFMLRYIEGDLARELEPNFSITVSKRSKKEYTKLDVLKMFDYFNVGEQKVTIYNEDNQKNELNPKVSTLFSIEKDHFEKLIKNVFMHNQDSCEYLSHSSEPLPICLTESDSGPGQVLHTLFCLEIFNAASIYCSDNPSIEIDI